MPWHGAWSLYVWRTGPERVTSGSRAGHVGILFLAGLLRGVSPAQLLAGGFVASLQMVLLALGTNSHHMQGCQGLLYTEACQLYQNPSLVEFHPLSDLLLSHPQ